MDADDLLLPPRLNYAPGQVLGVDDWRAEQAHWLQRWRRHLRFLHGWGVVSGLQVRLAGPHTLTVQPGLAIDCAGRELALAQPVSLGLPPLTDRLYLTLAYEERPVAPVPVVLADPADTGDGLVPSRVAEGATLAFSSAHPAPGHRRMGVGTPGCGQGHPLCIARLSPGRAGPRIEACSRHPRAR